MMSDLQLQFKNFPEGENNFFKYARRFEGVNGFQKTRLSVALRCTDPAIGRYKPKEVVTLTSTWTRSTYEAS